MNTLNRNTAYPNNASILSLGVKENDEKLELPQINTKF